MDVPSLMRQAALYNKHRRALIFENRSYTFSEAWERGVRVANALINFGIKPGDRVAAVEDNSIAAADFFVGAAIAGAVRVPLYARNSRDSHKAMLRSTGARVLFADAPYAPSVLELERELDSLERIIVRGDDYESWLARQSTIDPLVSVRDDDWYVIRHSSGTSGRPKGVGYTQHGWLANSRNWVYRLPRLDGDSVVAHAAPISHASGYLFLPAWLAGAANLMFRSFDVQNVLDVMESAPVTHAFLAPSMIAALSADKSANRGFPRLVCILSGGAPITDATIASCRRAFGDILHQVYGLTEAVPMTVMTPQEWFANIEGSKPLRSAGRILPFALLEIRNAEGKKLPIGEEGEIWCRCEAQMQGYWGDEELSKNRISDGWIRSGDIGRLDVNGYLYLLDRADDMIVSGGLNIFPAELETVIADHPKVIEVAVFGIPHDKWGETPMAVCRVATLGEITPEEIANLVTSRMGSYMKPTRVEFTTELLPKTVVGKLSRRTLRDPHWQGRDRRVGGA